jgi:hypothetical protein
MLPQTAGTPDKGREVLKCVAPTTDGQVAAYEGAWQRHGVRVETECPCLPRKDIEPAAECNPVVTEVDQQYLMPLSKEQQGRFYVVDILRAEFTENDNQGVFPQPFEE